MKTFSQKVWDACSRIPKGKVSTYKEIAKALNTKAYRAVGSALKKNPYAPEVPCHRVIASDGSLGGYCGKMNSRKKVSLLRSEGIEIDNLKIKNFEKRKFIFSSSSSS